MVDDSQPSLPARTGAVVIGGGIIGAVTALELAERGVSVVLCEKGAIAAEQSGRSLGWCRQMGREPREASLAALSLKLWRQLDQRVRQDTGFRQCGIMTLCDTDAELAAQERWLSRGGKTDEGPYMISADEVAHRVPGSARPWKGALFAPADGCAEPGMATAAIIAAAIRAGARIFTRCAVRGLDITAGRIAGVVTERGRIACDTVVLAGGAWVAAFLRVAWAVTSTIAELRVHNANLPGERRI